MKCTKCGENMIRTRFDNAIRYDCFCGYFRIERKTKEDEERGTYKLEVNIKKMV